MDDCEEFKVTVRDVPKALQAVRDYLKSEKGDLKGDDTSGSYSFKTYGSKISGQYSVKDKTIAIKAKIDGGLVSCGKFTDKLREAMK